MKRQSIIVVISGDAVEAWGNLKEVCEVHGWSYWTLVKKQFPIHVDGYIIHKTPFKQLSE